MENSILICTLLLSLSLFSQDVIILEDRSEINEETIKYKEYDLKSSYVK